MAAKAKARVHTDEETVGREDDFRIPASDARGHSVREWFRVQPGHDRQLEMVIQSRKWPYRTKGDVIRHAVVRHLYWLEGLAPIPSVMAEVDVMLDLLRDEAFALDFQRFFDRLGETIADYMARGMTGDCVRIVARALMRIREMPEGSRREEYEATLRKRYGHLPKSAPSAKLGRQRGRRGK